MNKRIKKETEELAKTFEELKRKLDGIDYENCVEDEEEDYLSEEEMQKEIEELTKTFEELSDKLWEARWK